MSNLLPRRFFSPGRLRGRLRSRSTRLEFPARSRLIFQRGRCSRLGPGAVSTGSRWPPDRPGRCAPATRIKRAAQGTLVALPAWSADVSRRPAMEQEGIGWIAALIIGGFAGWLAEKVTGSTMGLITNIILGVIGAGIAAWLFGLLGVRLQAGWLGYLISGFVGACLLI